MRVRRSVSPMRSETLVRSENETTMNRQSSAVAARLRIFDAHDRESWEEWLSAWRRCADGDLFSHPAYLVDRAEPGQAPLAAEFDDGHGSCVLFAFLLRRIDADALGRPVAQECFDITTALYYGGPLCSLADGTEEATLLETFWDRFRRWARSQRIVSEFHRENPMSGGLSSYPGQRIEQAGHVVKELDGRTEADLLGDTSKSFRRSVRKAEAADINVIVDETGERLDDFLDLYYATMDRNHASARFYYPRGFFDMLNTSFAGRVAYLYALDNGRPISAELVVYCAEIGYSVLGATEESSLRSGVNSLLSHQAFLYAQTRGIKHYVLGGGVTNAADDSLLRYKLSMAKSGLRRYFTGQQVIDEERYIRLSSGHSCNSTFFPTYRSGCSCEDSDQIADSESKR